MDCIVFLRRVCKFQIVQTSELIRANGQCEQVLAGRFFSHTITHDRINCIRQETSTKYLGYLKKKKKRIIVDINKFWKSLSSWQRTPVARLKEGTVP